MEKIWTVVQFVFVFGVLVFVHELGHFIVCKLLGIEVEEFGFGYPPRAVKLFTWKGTDFTLNWIPFGGFVRPKGESDENESGGLLAAPKWKRLLVLLAGASMNFLMGIVLLIVMFGVGGGVDSSRVMVSGVADQSPAYIAQLQPGDIITAVNGETVTGTEDFRTRVSSMLDTELTLNVDRNGQALSVKLTPRSNPPEGQGAIGISMTNPRVRYSFGQSITQAFGAFWEQVKTTVTLPVKLIQGAIKPADARIVGIKGIYDIFSNASQMDQVTSTQTSGFPIYRLAVISMVSIALGITNLLPIPALDGGQILFLAIEAISRGKVSQKATNIVNMVFFYLLIALMVFITIRDFVNPILGP